MDENMLIKPDDVEKRSRRRPTQEISEIEETEFSEETEKEIFYNRGGRVKIELETMGRFDLPEVLYFRGYNTKEIHDLTLSKPEDILETLVSVLNDMKNEDANCDIGDALLEEFFEILLGIKEQFQGPTHEHPWMCECQYGLPDEGQEISIAEINIGSINYTSIEEADEKLKNIVKETLEGFNEEQYTQYLQNKYMNKKIPEDHSLDAEVKNIKIKEPMSITVGNDVYLFRYMRVRDLIKAQKMARKEFQSKLKKIKKEKIANMPLAELKAFKQDETEKLKMEEAKTSVLYCKALTLIGLNGQELSDVERIEKFINMPSDVVIEMTEFLDKVQFGIDHEIEVFCQVCGTPNKRWLQQSLNPLELLPSGSNSKPGNGLPPRINVHFGI